MTVILNIQVKDKDDAISLINTIKKIAKGSFELEPVASNPDCQVTIRYTLSKQK